MQHSRVKFLAPDLRGECSVTGDRIFLMYCQNRQPVEARIGYVVMAEVDGVTEELQVDDVWDGAISFRINR